MSKRSIKRGVKVVLVLIVFLAISFFVNAFGVSTPYFENNTVKVMPGKSYSYALTIQNNDDQNYTVEFNYSPKNIVSMDQKEYAALSKTYDTTAYLTLNIPPDASVGTRFVVDYSLRPKIANNESIVVGVELKRSFNVIITDANNNIPQVEPKTEEKILQKITSTSKETYVKIKNNPLTAKIGKYALILISMIAAIIIIIRLWRLSKSISIKIIKNDADNSDLSKNTAHVVHEHTRERKIIDSIEKYEEKQSGNKDEDLDDIPKSKLDKTNNIAAKPERKYTLSEAENLMEVYAVIKKMDDKEFVVPEIRHIFKRKIEQLTSDEIAEDFSRLSRRQAMNYIKKISK